MNGRYLLDTSIIIELLLDDQIVTSQLGKAESTFLPGIAIGDLHFGARKSARQQENLEQINRLVDVSIVLPCDVETGYWYGIVKDNLRRSGKPILENDVWIAALARQHNLTLATRDRHFEAVGELNVEMW